MRAKEPVLPGTPENAYIVKAVVLWCYSIEVTLEGNKIKDIRILQHNESPE
jgi:hypothetical protein